MKLNDKIGLENHCEPVVLSITAALYSNMCLIVMWCWWCYVIVDLLVRLFNEHYLKLGRYITQTDYNKLRNNLIRELSPCLLLLTSLFTFPHFFVYFSSLLFDIQALWRSVQFEHFKRYQFGTDGIKGINYKNNNADNCWCCWYRCYN